MKILVVGDTHGEWGRLNRLLQKKQPDLVLQLGDFGWWPGLEVTHPVLYGQQKEWLLKGVKPGDAKVLWCDGNHEDHSALTQDGETHEMYKGVYHASRGSTFTLPDGRVVLFAGGATSVDKRHRTPGHDWFSGENITDRELDRMLAHEKVDIVVSHTCPHAFDLQSCHGSKESDSNRLALDYVLRKYSPGLWLFGHWHQHVTGKHDDTVWVGLDYPGHRGRWWMWLP